MSISNTGACKDVHKINDHPLRDKAEEAQFQQLFNGLPPITIASNKCETLFISSAGDLLTSRCRYTPYPSGATDARGKQNPYQWTNDIAAICCDSDSAHDDIQVSCSPWGPTSNVVSSSTVPGGDGQPPGHAGSGVGLLGGAPLRVDAIQNSSVFISPPPHHHHRSAVPRSPSKDIPNGSTESSSSPINHSRQTFRSSPIHFGNNSGFDEGSIVPIKSFDYSQFNEGGNDMVPESPYDDGLDVVTAEGVHTAGASQQHLFHGIPTFLPYFSNIKVRQVSAHPLGAHVLLISQPGILYSYGLNNYGQLGIGILSNVRDVHQGFIMKPTMVTPLLENGGKAIACAAGATHSLVVVETEERRITKSHSSEVSFDTQTQQQRSPALRVRRNQSEVNYSTSSNNNKIHSEISEAILIKHHQMYGFGRNDNMKIGLVSPKLSAGISKTSSTTGSTTVAAKFLDDMEHVPLPRRVALRCSVRHSNSSIGYETTIGLNPCQGIFAIAASVEHSAALVRRTSGDVELYTWGNATFGALGLPQPPMSESSAVPSTTAFRVVPVPSFVACLSKSSNPEARLQSLLLNDVEEYPMNMSLSRCCSFVVTSIGRCFSFGTSEDGMLGLGRGITETRHPMEITMPEQARSEMITSVSAGAWHVTSCTKSGNVYSWGAQSHAGFAVPRPTSVLPSQQQQQRRPPTMKGPTPIEDLLRFEWSPRQVLFTPQIDRSTKHHSDLSNDTNVPIVQVCSGNDCTFFFTESGRVLSSGKSSGRLGQGEVDHDVTSPKPLFGGLHLFQQENNNYINHPLTIPRHRQNHHQNPIQQRTNGPTVEYSSFGVTIQAV